MSKILGSLVTALQLGPACPELVAATAQAAAVLLRLAEDLAGRTGELVELLQLQFAAVTPSADEHFPDLGDLVVRCGELWTEAVLDGVLGYVLLMLEGQSARVPWLQTLLRLLQLDGAVVQVYQLGEEYEASAELLMDWLLTCGDHTTQARLVEALLRWVASRPSPPQADRARPPARHGRPVVPRQRARPEHGAGLPCGHQEVPEQLQLSAGGGAAGVLPGAALLPGAPLPPPSLP